MKNEKKDMLQVKLFGNFSVVYGDKNLCGSKQGESQFIYLIQLLLHYQEKGVSRAFLEEILFGERILSDVHHALRSVIYSAKKRLEAAGLPKDDYIISRDGMLFWTEHIPVETDARRFEALLERAEKSENKERRLALLLDACHCYSGEFLASYSGEIWVASEARRYSKLFRECVEKAAGLLKDKQDYAELEKLGNYAARVNPFADWEILIMEALIGRGEDKAALDLRVEIEKHYLDNHGIRPSQRLMEAMNQLSEQVLHPQVKLDSIQMELQGDKECGAFLCSYPVFKGIYQMEQRLEQRNGQSSALILCTIMDSKGNVMQEGSHLERLSQRLCKAIRKSVRKCDIVSRYGKSQYLILLVNCGKADCEDIEKRIDDNFYKGKQRIELFYSNDFTLTEFNGA